jgi:hypothetical protein
VLDAVRVRANRENAEGTGRMESEARQNGKRYRANIERIGTEYRANIE